HRSTLQRATLERMQFGFSVKSGEGPSFTSRRRILLSRLGRYLRSFIAYAIYYTNGLVAAWILAHWSRFMPLIRFSQSNSRSVHPAQARSYTYWMPLTYSAPRTSLQITKHFVTL